MEEKTVEIKGYHENGIKNREDNLSDTAGINSSIKNNNEKKDDDNNNEDKDKGEIKESNENNNHIEEMYEYFNNLKKPEDNKNNIVINKINKENENVRYILKNSNIKKEEPKIINFNKNVFKIFFIIQLSFISFSIKSI